ncbi:GNAT family N-acetyltransferase [Modestobacter sp. I12A-02628]|uniref:Acetyltransferase n=1 Tax=Goekera deserti TaxID=2497753 RepID=A0A7K3WCA3_9ACTN|nr:GNAT family N-acetyltransferase [Goekera deserti]MPQ98519.1 GNAT family N-acetyltransferase [Goekera deserti]NDI48349.1 GNAT family N-acetyltransferase [Goekera deserti]NEL54098.1 acetyltransferase [Goekera deserti]
MADEPITFRPLRRSDLPLLAGWLAEPLVHRWWHDEHDPATLERDYGPCIDGAEPTQVFLAEQAGRPFGLIQRYEITSYPEDAAELDAVYPVPPGAISVDYLIGEPAARGRGLGGRMVAAFVELCWAAHPHAQDVVVPVAAGNAASWRSLEAAGFARVAEGGMTPDNPVDPRDHVVYRLRRPD